MTVQTYSTHGGVVRTETIAGVQCLHLEAEGADIEALVALWRGVHLALKGGKGKEGVCIYVKQPIGPQGMESLFCALSGLPAASVVVCPQDYNAGKRLALESAERGEIRAIFGDLLTAVVWIAARAKALLLARTLPRLEPELLARKRVRAQ